MAELVSPGVSITVTDESFYAAAGTGTVPLIVVATAQDKASPAGTGIAQYTTAANAGEVKLVTSQRDLITNYGNPIFKSLNGTPLPGHELNEYGLLAAYSFLGLANRAYVLRADIDLGALEGSSIAPSSKPVDGTYWLDTTNTTWALKRWSGSAWVRQTVKVPAATDITVGPEPKAAYGKKDDYAVVYVDANGVDQETVTFFQKILDPSDSNIKWFEIGTDAWNTALGGSADYQIGTHIDLSRQSTSIGGTLAVGDLFLQTNLLDNGTSISIKSYDSVSDQFLQQLYYGADHSYQAYSYYDSIGGVNAGDIWIDYSSASAQVNLYRHNGLPTVVAQSAAALADDEISSTGHTTGTIAMTITVNDRDVVEGASGKIEVTFAGYDDTNGNISVDGAVEAISAAISNANDITLASDLEVTNVSGKITITSISGYDIKLEKGNVVTFDPTDLNLVEDIPYSNWETLEFQASATEITGTLADGKLWYDSLIDLSRLDILYNNNGTWESYPNDINLASSEPVTKSNGITALAAGDLWVSTADRENYPTIYKYSGSAWAQVDNTDQVSREGILFADFRSAGGSIDDDAPDSVFYPYGMLAWNKRASGGNVKQWSATNARWEDYSGNKPDGSPYMLRKAQRAGIVRQMQAALNANTDIRNETNRFNLIAAPGYPELLDEMIALNTDRKETAFIITDAPLRLASSGASTQAWATNSNSATVNGEDGLVTRYAYSAVYYPHAVTSNLDGQNVVVPSSHVALRTLAYNDQVAFPWFAPAGFQRGVVTNASDVGYIDAASSEFVSVALSEGQRDALYINNVNPIANFPGRGLNVFGQKTLSPTASALDRVNVARLVVYIRERLDDLVKPFLFEPNDEVTRQNAKVLVDRFLANLVSQRGVYDFVVVCDETNNTPERIDRNELYIDVAIQPVKAVEFIYIPIRVQNTLGQSN